MTNTQTILKMIEDVSPDDTAKLDEIDTRVHEYLGFHWHGDSDSSEHKIYAGHWGYTPRTRMYMESLVCDCKSDTEFAPEPKEYTRSRDALKAIRPEGWRFCLLDNNQCGWIAIMSLNGNEKIIESRTLTEELAEIHAIIQAIEHERTHK